MAKSKSAKRAGKAAREQARQLDPPPPRRIFHDAAQALFHLREPDEPVWKYLLPLLALAFIVRAAVALGGEFVLHPDEIMQYL